MIAKISPSLVLILICATSAIAQSIYVVKGGEDPLDILPKHYRFLNTEYKEGFLAFPNNKKTGPFKINYDLFNKVIIFVNERGDTLSLSGEMGINYVQMGNDIYYHDLIQKGYFKVLQSDSVHSLTSNEELTRRTTGSTSDEGYGSSTNGTSAAISVIGKEDTTFERLTKYFLMDERGAFTNANRSGFLRMFNKQDKQIKTYLKQSFVDFKKEEDMVRLFSYCLSLQSGPAK